MKKNKFYVILEEGCTGEFGYYDILPYLSQEWNELKPKKKEEAKKDLQEWVDKTLKYRFWSRCQYEVLLLPWPSSDRDRAKKVDVYWQASPNLELITRLFSENEKIII